MKYKPRWWALVATVVAGSGYWFWQQPKDDGVTYRTAKIERGSLQAAVSASGTINPVVQVSVGTQVSGQIKELLVDFNAVVKKNDLIARIDPESFQYRLRQAQADLEAAKAAVLNAQANVGAVDASVLRARLEAENAARDLQRKQDLLAKAFISQADYETARNLAATLAQGLKVVQSQLDVARAQVSSAQAVVRQREASLSQAQVDLERTEIRSPVDGVVIKRAVDVGQTVAASLQAPELFVIAQNLSNMQVEASIDEADIARVRAGQKVTFTVDAFPGRSFDGQVGQVRKSAVSQQNVVTYTVVVPFANRGDVLLPGMTANVRIVTDNRDDVLKVPNAALRVRVAGVEPAPEPSKAGASNAASSGDAPARGAGGPLREFRDRVVTELGLSPDQTAQIDSVLAEARPRFAELRNQPEDSRAKLRERLLADVRSQIGEKLTAEQRPKYQQLLAQASGRGGSTRGRLYTLGADGQPRAVAVRLGVSDGVSTELVLANEAAPIDLKEGAVVVVGVNNPAAVAPRSPAAGAPRPPF